MTHLKRSAMPKTWPLPRKGTKYIIMPHGPYGMSGIPIAILLKTALKIADNLNQIKEILNEKQVLVNGKVVKDPKFSVGVFDIITIHKLKMNYLVTIENKKITMKEISAADAKNKFCKVIGKNKLAKGKIQINLYGGRNILTDEKVRINDSIILNLEKNKIMKILPLKEGFFAKVIGGKHIGASGEIKKIEKRVFIKLGGNLAEVEKKNVFVFEQLSETKDFRSTKNSKENFSG